MSSNPATFLLAQHTLNQWLTRQRLFPDVDQETHNLIAFESHDISVQLLSQLTPGDDSSFQASIFCINQDILLLNAAGILREANASNLLNLFQENNHCHGGSKATVILDLSEVTTVAYQARKKLLLALHVLRNKSKEVYIVGSSIIHNLLEMYNKMYPLAVKRVRAVSSLLEAIQLSTTPPTVDINSSIMSSQQSNLHQHSGSKLIQNASQHDQLEQLRALLNSAPDPIFSLDLQGRFLDTNHAGRTFFAQFLDQIFIPGKFFQEAWPYFDSETWPEVLSLLARDQLWQGQAIFELAGKTTYYQVSFTPVKYKGGDVESISLFLRDITQERTAEEEAKYQTELIDSISYSIQEGLFRSSPQRGIMFVNKAFVEMFGYDSEEEVMKLDPYELYVDINRRDDFVRIAKARNSFLNEEVYFKRKDGSTFWGLMSSVRKIDQNGMVYHDGAIRDVTQLREAQLRIQEKNEELTKVNRELDSFVYRVSHDLRAPLVSLLGLISITKIEDSAPKKERYLELMEKSIHRLDSFILDIMNYSRNSRIQLNSEHIQLHHLIDEIVDTLKYSQDGPLKIENLTDPAIIANTDPLRLKPILNNLISNAIRYRDTNKAEQTVVLNARRLPNGIELSVADNGIGIAEEHQEKVFNMFFRASRKSEGSGIGLYIVQETVGKLKGEIALESELGVGSTFTLRLPDFPEAMEE